ncbi:MULTISPECIES: helix-turn-helix transcriptional regulator [Paraburkholderia]|uniref:helix-turn-helix transcriptional regulator n=1 Tax=Paraburkholderia TaxID=1822464 RepID=UPI0032181A18
MQIEVSRFRDSQDFAEQTVNFARSVLHCSAAVFTWADSTEQFLPHTQIGWPESTIKEYYSVYASADPLNIYRLIKQRATVVMLRGAKREEQHTPWAEYQHKFGLADEVGFMFWSGDTPIGCLSAIQTSQDQPFSGQESFSQIHTFMEHGLSLLPAVKRFRAQAILKHDYFLTERELDVARLISSGLSNKDIGDVLSIELATVKSHVIRILGKLGLDSRTQIAAFLSDTAAPRLVL